MIRKLIYVLVCVFAASVTGAQAKKAAAGATPGAAARLCADPYSLPTATDSWPQGPVMFLFHRENSKAPWARNPVIKAPGLEAASAASARTVVCVEESLSEKGKYDSGEPGYTADWSITLVDISGKRLYFTRTGFYGEDPPFLKFHRGPAVGKRPVEAMVSWLRLVVNQKVARLRMRLRTEASEEISAMAFSADNTRLVAAQEARSRSDSTPPSPITIFDLATRKAVTTLIPRFPARYIAISKSGNMIAADAFRSIEVWDIASGKITHTLSAPEIASLAFGPDDCLAVAGGNQAVLWNVANESKIKSVSGSYMVLSPAGLWLVAKKEANSLVVTELDTGKTVSSFPKFSGQEKLAISKDGSAAATFSLVHSALFVAGNPQAQSLAAPGPGLGMMYSIMPTRDGVITGNGDGVVGVASSASAEPRFLGTDHLSIRSVAVSPDGKLLAVGDSFGAISIWELL
ncbi:MAG TPA: WD40 repeat domain-containing protein [Candidatus Angelobacter sp.]|nr:WD40 repeat domain-containing protein [Candidatus Angelobacter sp.]